MIIVIVVILKIIITKTIMIIIITIIIAKMTILIIIAILVSNLWKQTHLQRSVTKPLEQSHFCINVHPYKSDKLIYVCYFLIENV